MGPSPRPGARWRSANRFKFQRFRVSSGRGPRGSGQSSANRVKKLALESGHLSCSTCDLCTNVNALGSKDAYTHATHAHSHTQSAQSSSGPSPALGTDHC